MKRARVWALVFTIILGGVARSQDRQSGGDVWLWIPYPDLMSAKDAQIVRNAQYVSINIAAAHVSYKSGFLENIKRIVVHSSVSFNLKDQNVQALTVNQTWVRETGRSEDDLPIHDNLAELSPASPIGISIKMGFNGIGQDRFKAVFDILASPDIKTALNFSPAVIAKAGLVTSIAQKLLASPYTDSNPKNVLAMTKGYVVYPDRNDTRPDSLKQGYFVVISGTERKNNDLRRVIDLASDKLRFDEEKHVLQLKQADGTWRAFTGNSYMVLSITANPVRGIEENTEWFRKFAEAEKTTEKLKTGANLGQVKKDAFDRWNEGVTLLSADPNYIETERKSIRLKFLEEIQKALMTNGISAADASFALFTSEMTRNFLEEVVDYERDVQIAKTGFLTIEVLDSKGAHVPGITVTLAVPGNADVKTAVSDEMGFARFASIPPDDAYSIRAEVKGFKSVVVGPISVAPRQRNKVTIRIGSGKDRISILQPSLI